MLSTSATSSPSPTSFVIASGNNDRQVEAIVDEVEDKLRELGVKPLRREGERDGRWVLLDYGEIVVHVQHDEERRFYALERLWRDCPTIPFDPSSAGRDAPIAGRDHRRTPVSLTSRGVSRVLLLRHGRTAVECRTPFPGPGRPAAGRCRSGAGLRGGGLVAALRPGV